MTKQTTNNMNDIITRYIGAIIVSLFVALISTAFNLGAKVIQLEDNQIELRKQLMNRELLEEKFKNVDNQLKHLEVQGVKHDEKLDLILQKIRI